MKSKFHLFLLVLSFSNFAQDIELNKILGKRLKTSMLIPTTFQVVREIKGDLNKDGEEDLILIAQKKLESSSMSKKQYLLVYKKVESDLYENLVIGANHLLDGHDGFMDKDGIIQADIVNSVFTIQTSNQMSAGSWSSTTCTQKWRMEGNKLRLIGLTVATFDRSCICGDSVDHNLITGDKVEENDKGKDGEKLEKSVVIKSKIKSAPIYWENFSYEKSCEL